jgi:hypothetical protein
VAERIENTETCVRCNGAIWCDPNPVNALSIVVAGGGYAMFLDDGEDTDILLCHDCAVEFYRFMGFHPQTNEQYRGLHSYSGDTPCCEYSWTFGKPTGEYERYPVEYGYRTFIEKARQLHVRLPIEGHEGHDICYYVDGAYSHPVHGVFDGDLYIGSDIVSEHITTTEIWCSSCTEVIVKAANLNDEWEVFEDEPGDDLILG